MELGGGPAARLHWERDRAMACCLPSADGSGSCDTLGMVAAAQRVSLAWKEQRPSPMAAAAEGNCVSPGVGSSVPGARKTLVVFLRFFHLARRFWNQTCGRRAMTHTVSDTRAAVGPGGTAVGGAAGAGPPAGLGWGPRLPGPPS